MTTEYIEVGELNSDKNGVKVIAGGKAIIAPSGVTIKDAIKFMKDNKTVRCTSAMGKTSSIETLKAFYAVSKTVQLHEKRKSK